MKRQMMMRGCVVSARVAVMVGAVALSAWQGAAVGQTTDEVKLTRVYVPGEVVGYKMTGLNEGPQRTVKYEAHATGVVKKDAARVFVEEFRWSGLQVNGAAFGLSPESIAFREPLSVDPKWTLTVPDLSKVQPVLIGPITDLLTFYADVQLAMRQSGLVKAGDHVYVKHGVPNSWADGSYVVLGQDSIDFDITLVSVDKERAKLVVRHVPPAEPQIKIPAEWMKEPVGTAKNNWVEVEKIAGDGGRKYVAEIGEESFEADIELDAVTGKILSARLDNPVEVKERDCDDAALTMCGEAKRYKILRQIGLEAETAK